MIENFENLGKILGKMDSSVESLIQKLGFSYNQFALLYTLYFSLDRKCTQKQVCAEWLLSKQTIFNICKEYRQKGWIEIADESDDKRERVIGLTRLGLDSIEPIFTQFVAINERVFAKFGDKKTKQLFNLLSEITKIYQDEVDKI